MSSNNYLFKLTVSLRCYMRPQRTLRMLNCIMQQLPINNQFVGNKWELCLTGDACPHFNDDSFRELVQKLRSRANKDGNDIRFSNELENKGGCGYAILNKHIQAADGEYFLFLSNDDMILPHHFLNYYKAIAGTDLDFMYFDSFVNPFNCKRNAQLQPGMIGHSELIIRTDFLKTMPQHGPEYGHDWKLVQDMMAATDKYAKGENAEPTYYVMSVPGNVEQGLD